jgi:hypothetical protein
MSTLELLRRLYVAGVDVTLNSEGGIRVSGSPPPPEVMAALKANRDAVLDILREHRIGSHDDGYPSVVPRCYVTPPGCLAPRLCARLGPCSAYLLQRPCNGSDGTS